MEYDSGCYYKSIYSGSFSCPNLLRKNLPREGGQTGSLFPGGSYLPRSPSRSDQPVLRKGTESDAGGGDHRPQDFANVEKVYSPEGRRLGGVAEMILFRVIKTFFLVLGVGLTFAILVLLGEKTPVFL